MQIIVTGKLSQSAHSGLRDTVEAGAEGDIRRIIAGKGMQTAVQY